MKGLAKPSVRNKGEERSYRDGMLVVVAGKGSERGPVSPGRKKKGDRDPTAASPEKGGDSLGPQEIVGGKPWGGKKKGEKILGTKKGGIFLLGGRESTTGR